MIRIAARWQQAGSAIGHSEPDQPPPQSRLPAAPG